MKKLFRVCILLGLGAWAAFAVNFTALQPQGYVSDFAGVIDAGSRERLAQYCGALEQSTGIQLAIVTLPTLSGEPIEDVANDLFRKWGIGHKGKDDGLLLLLAIRDRRSRLEVGRGLEPEIVDGLAGYILDSMRPYLRQQRYGDALLEGAGAIGQRISQVRHIQIGSAPVPQQRRLPREGSPAPLLFFGAIILFFFLSSLLGPGRRGGRGGGGMGGFLTGMILGNMMRGGWGGRSGGGGFGGYDSSDGFGGFGGGDSGGGGASSDW